MALRRVRFVHVDVFTRVPFGGNQLAVFPEADELTALEMQTIAREMNFSESTFVLAGADSGRARVRIFTPGRELPFAGHPVVGTAWVLGSERGVRELVLELAASNVAVDVDAGDDHVGSAAMEQPVPRFRAAAVDASVVAGMLGLDAGELAPGLPVEYGSAGVEFLFVPLRSLDAVRRARPDPLGFPRFFAGADHAAAYVFATETVAADAAAQARMFFVVLGSEVREDAATGSAAGPCGAYLVRHGRRPAGALVIEQGVELGRPSRIEVAIGVRGDALERVQVGGGVVRMTEGRLFLAGTSARASAA